jgi:hypothetical protein
MEEATGMEESGTGRVFGVREGEWSVERDLMRKTGPEHGGMGRGRAPDQSQPVGRSNSSETDGSNSNAGTGSGPSGSYSGL